MRRNPDDQERLREGENGTPVSRATTNYGLSEEIGLAS